ncbi:MAG: hypothetical protein PHV53_01880 [Fermentimonas sp.]|nr:hypothetical protein [Fermentimonas sp.]
MPYPFTFMFYNTENFYDTENDPLTMDDDYTPDGFREWTYVRYLEKLQKMTKVVRDIVAPDIPDIIGLAEIENKSVMTGILDSLRNNGITGYSFIHYDSPDERGSDVALIYNTQTFTVKDSKPITVRLPGIEDRTRDILYVAGKLKNDETIHLFITHFPSRSEGREKSERRRYFVASELRHEVYRVLSSNPSENIVIMGDFNDTPDDNSIDEVLGAKKKFEKIDPLKLYNLLYPRYKKGIGSTYHDGWQLFDQIIVSGSLLLSENIICKPEFADVFNPQYLLHFDSRGQAKPNRTYSGNYKGGYSDHLPVFMRIMLK